MILIGATGKNAGKTVAACAIIKAIIKAKVQGSSLTALKVTTAGSHGSSCHRGGEGCGACVFEGNFVLSEELNPAPAKDTARLLAAGAERVFWLRAKRPCLASGFKTFLDKMPNDSIILGESNSLREVVKPGLFLMLNNTNEPIKPSARKVWPYADLTFESQGTITKAEADNLAQNLLATQALKSVRRSS
jgi:hypothetical protein